jgi:amino acid transporter
MVVIKAGGANTTSGGAEAVGVAMGKGLGIIVALILAWVFVTATVVYNYAFARLLFVSGMEKRLPHQFGKVNRNKVPANGVILQTIIGSVITILIFFIFGAGGSDYLKAFYILYAGLTIVWCISTALLFLDIFFAKRANPERSSGSAGSQSSGSMCVGQSGRLSTSSPCCSSSWARGTRPGSRRSPSGTGG